jgi:WD repeat-containing protein 81
MNMNMYHNIPLIQLFMFMLTALYGEQLIVLQYLPHMGELIALCKRKLTANLEAGLVGCLALLKHIIPYLCDTLLMDQLQVCVS